MRSRWAGVRSWNSSTSSTRAKRWHRVPEGRIAEQTLDGAGDLLVEVDDAPFGQLRPVGAGDTVRDQTRQAARPRRSTGRRARAGLVRGRRSRVRRVGFGPLRKVTRPPSNRRTSTSSMVDVGRTSRSPSAFSVRTRTPATSARRSLISFAALDVVGDQGDRHRGKAPALEQQRARSVSTLVLPEPAGAMTRAPAPARPRLRAGPAPAGRRPDRGAPSGPERPVFERDPVNHRPYRLARRARLERSAVAESGGAFGTTTSASPSMRVAPSWQATVGPAPSAARRPCRCVQELAHTAWCNRSPTRSRSAGHSHGCRPVNGLGGRSLGIVEPEARHELDGDRAPLPPSRAELIRRRTVHCTTRIRSHDDHSRGGGVTRSDDHGTTECFRVGHPDLGARAAASCGRLG